MLVITGPSTKRTSSTAELIQQEGVPKKPRTGDPPLDRHQATLLSEVVGVNPTTLQPELSTASQAQMPQTAVKPPKGRRRFMVDLEELKSAGFSLHNHRLHSTWSSVRFHWRHRPMCFRRIAPRGRRRIRRVCHPESESSSRYNQSPRLWYARSLPLSKSDLQLFICL